jgi:hypothetical protein
MEWNSLNFGWVSFRGTRESDYVADQRRLEAEGKYLAFTNGKNGYFTDWETAKLLAEGDRGRQIQPIFSDDRHAPHYSVAYGSLIVSEGMTSAAVTETKILVIDDEQQSHGVTPLTDIQGRALSLSQVEKLYDKMGDGTMLLSSKLMAQLI